MKSFIENTRELLEHDENRELLERKLITAISILTKLEREKNPDSGFQKVSG